MNTHLHTHISLLGAMITSETPSDNFGATFEFKVKFNDWFEVFWSWGTFSYLSLVVCSLNHNSLSLKKIHLYPWSTGRRLFQCKNWCAAQAAETCMQKTWAPPHCSYKIITMFCSLFYYDVRHPLPTECHDIVFTFQKVKLEILYSK